MKTAIVAVAVAIFCVASAQPNKKIICFEPTAIVHDTETFAQCLQICKDNNGNPTEITPVIYECMLEHFEVVDSQGNVDVSVLKTKINTVAIPTLRQRFIGILDNTCKQTKVKELAQCLDGQLEGICKDGEA